MQNKRVIHNFERVQADIKKQEKKNVYRSH